MNRKAIITLIACMLLALMVYASLSDLVAQTSVRETATFSEPMIESAVREELKRPGGALFQDEIYGLRELYLTGTDCDISEIAQMQNLVCLRLEIYKLSDVSSISSMVHLKDLQITNSIELLDISPLKGLVHLERLGIERTAIADISVVENMPELKVFWAYFTGITDITALKNLNKLEDLDLAFDYISDISPLRGKTCLKSLNLRETSVQDIEILKTLSSLEKLDIWETPITEEQYLELKEALPNCAIRWGHDT